jgi:uncharacterized protein (TIGR00251 family)
MDAMGTAIGEHRDGTAIAIKAYPSSSRRGLGAPVAGRIAVYVHSSPEKGKANTEVVKVLCEALGVSSSRVDVIRGHSSRHKTIVARGLPPTEVARLLLEQRRKSS